MKKRMILVVAVAALAMAAACKKSAAVSAAPPQGEAAEQCGVGGQNAAPNQEQDEMTIVGVLKPTVEAGGWILDTEEGEYLLLRLSGFTDQPWFEVGRRLRAKGRVDRDVMTTFMQGTPFVVSHLEPAVDPGHQTGPGRGAVK